MNLAQCKQHALCIMKKLQLTSHRLYWMILNTKRPFKQHRVLSQKFRCIMPSFRHHFFILFIPPLWYVYRMSETPLGALAIANLIYSTRMLFHYTQNNCNSWWGQQTQPCFWPTRNPQDRCQSTDKYLSGQIVTQMIYTLWSVILILPGLCSVLAH